VVIDLSRKSAVRGCSLQLLKRLPIIDRLFLNSRERAAAKLAIYPRSCGNSCNDLLVVLLTIPGSRIQVWIMKEDAAGQQPTVDGQVKQLYS